jgi:hypothetical protein
MKYCCVVNCKIICSIAVVICFLFIILQFDTSISLDRTERKVDVLTSTDPQWGGAECAVRVGVCAERVERVGVCCNWIIPATSKPVQISEASYSGLVSHMTYHYT